MSSNIIGIADSYLMNRDFHKLGDVYSLVALVKDKLDSIAERGSDSIWDPIAYRYNDVCLRYYNHNGNSAHAIRHRNRGVRIYKRLSAVKDVSEHRKFHEFLNRYSVCDTNAFAFDRAIAGLDNPRIKEKQLSEIFPNERNEILGKIYGSLMQNYAFMGKYKEAEEYLDLAKGHLGQVNYMQISYEAHLAVDRKDEKKYKKCLDSIFKLDNFNSYCDLLLPFMKNYNRPAFDFHLLLKDFLTFSSNNRDCRNTEGKVFAFSRYILEELEIPNRKRDEAVPFYKTSSELKENLWELVFIVMGRILAKLNEPPSTQMAIKLWQKAANFATDQAQHTFVMVGHSARCWQALFELERKNWREARKLLFAIRNTFEDLKNTNRVIGTFNPNRITDPDGNIRLGWFDSMGEKFLVDFSSKCDNGVVKNLCHEFLDRFTFNYW